MIRLRIYALLALLLSAFGPGVGWAAYCMSSTYNGTNTFFIYGTQPQLPSTCSFIAISGTEWANYQNALTTISTLNSQVSALQTQSNTSTSNITSLQNSVTSLNTSVASLNASVGTINTGMAIPFDYTFAAGVFGLFFASVVSLWWVSKSAGTIIDAVRKF